MGGRLIEQGPERRSGPCRGVEAIRDRREPFGLLRGSEEFCPTLKRHRDRSPGACVDHHGCAGRPKVDTNLPALLTIYGPRPSKHISQHQSDLNNLVSCLVSPRKCEADGWLHTGPDPHTPLMRANACLVDTLGAITE